MMSAVSTTRAGDIPMGGRAVALFRNMICAPCYLSKAEDCPRALACIRLLDPAQVRLGRLAHGATVRRHPDHDATRTRP